MNWDTSGYTPPHETLKRPYPFAEDEPLFIGGNLGEPLIVQPLVEETLLLGSIVGVNAQLRGQTSGVPHTLPVLTMTGPVVGLEVFQKGDYYALRDQHHEIARLDNSFCSAARRLEIFGVQFHASLEWASWESLNQRPFARGDETTNFILDINVYGSETHADRIGSLLLNDGIFLQMPKHNPFMQMYYNPQIMEVYGFQPKPEELVDEGEEPQVIDSATKQPAQSGPLESNKVSNHVDLILNSLSHGTILHEIRIDTHLVKSQLLGHQMTALDFIAQRESGRPPRELTLWREKRKGRENYFQHILTRAKSPDQLEAKGGIIADDMGLGKSLTILAAIARSLHEAARFGTTWEEGLLDSSESPIPSRATLILVPSTILIDNWIQEIRAHTYPYKVKFHKHLGTERHSELPQLFQNDVIFTTFATAAQNAKRGASPLSKINWFRIVLDEAHKIRNHKTDWFKTVHQLQAQYRWCLTGTPIQNRLEDLGSLIQFLRIPYLERASTFRTHIITPTSPDHGSQFQNLQTLLGTICLRRTRDIINVPEPIVHSRVVCFSESERHQYEELYEHYKRHVQMSVSGVRASTTLQSIHELRLFCNNGPRRTDKEVRDSDERLSYLEQLEQNMCAKCSLPIFCIDPMGDKNTGLFLPCKHLVCQSCLSHCLSKKKSCLLCGSENPPPIFGHRTDAEMIASTAPQESFEYPSKLLTLLHDIKMTPSQRCIVFSSWKKTLDLVGDLLKEHGLKFDIMHGSLSSKQRLKVLKDFKSIMGPNILLMTLGTGAEGLNLTIASHIYLLEPQWNPFLEQQAMARAQRIGQTKQVVCVSYIVEGTIEQSDVLNRQKRKRALAGGGFKQQNKEKLQSSLQYFGLG